MKITVKQLYALNQHAAFLDADSYVVGLRDEGDGTFWVNYEPHLEGGFYLDGDTELELTQDETGLSFSLDNDDCWCDCNVLISSRYVIPLKEEPTDKSGKWMAQLFNTSYHTVRWDSEIAAWVCRDIGRVTLGHVNAWLPVFDLESILNSSN